MLIGTADKLYVAALGALVTNIYIGWEIAAGKVADVYWAIGIG
jgi:hypothetical protein